MTTAAGALLEGKASLLVSHLVSVCVSISAGVLNDFRQEALRGYGGIGGNIQAALSDGAPRSAPGEVCGLGQEVHHVQLSSEHTGTDGEGREDDEQSGAGEAHFYNTPRRCLS